MSRDTLPICSSAQLRSTAAGLQPFTAADTHDQHSSAQHVMTSSCRQHKLPQHSHARQLSASSASSRDNVPRKRRSTQISQCPQQTASLAWRAVRACQGILPAAVATTTASCTTSSSVDAKARLRAVILSGQRRRQAQRGTSLSVYTATHAND